MELTTSVILQRLVLAIILGSLMGLERDNNLKKLEKTDDKKRKEAKSKFSFIKSSTPASGLGGFRTYILIALLGSISGISVAAGIPALMWIISIGITLFILLSFVLNYFDKNTFGLTTEISIIIVYTLSLLLFASDIEPKLIVAISIFNSFILSIKSQTKVIVSKFSSDEIVDTIKFILLVLVILPFLPNETFSFAQIPQYGPVIVDVLGKDLVDALAVFNPYKLWMVVVLVSGLNFAGYFMTKIFGKTKGLNILGLMGGLISSTAVTEAMASASKGMKSKASKDALINATILANITSFIRILLISSLINLALGLKLILPMLVMATFLGIWFLVVNTNINKKGRTKKSVSNVGISFKSPFSYKPALIFMFIYLGVTVFTKVAHYYLGESGFIVSTMISSMSGLDAITINTANLAGGDVTMSLGVVALVVAACVNLIIKAAFSALIGDGYFRRKIFMLFTITILFGIGAMVFVLLV